MCGNFLDPFFTARNWFQIFTPQQNRKAVWSMARNFEEVDRSCKKT